MKKKLAVILACTLAAAAALGGCKAEETEEEEVVSTETEEEEVIPTDEMLAMTDYDVTECVTLPADYMDLTIELSENYDVTDKDVQEFIEEDVLAYYPGYAQTDKTTVEDGDVVNIDFVGILDGEEFEGGSDEGYELTIGSGTFIDGFEDGLLEQEVGTTVDLDLTFPENYGSEDLAGQDVVFVVTINSIDEERTLTFDEITDEYVENLYGTYGITTVDELFEEEKEYLTSYLESMKEYEIQSLVQDALIDGSTVTLPEGMVEERLESFLEEIREAAEEYEMSYEEYVTSTGEYADVDEYEQITRESVEDYAVLELILEAIVADQRISVSRSEFDDFVNQFVANLGTYYGMESTEDFYDYYGGEDAAILNYAERMALTMVEDAATVVMPEKEPDPVPEEEEETEETGEEEAAGEGEATDGEAAEESTEAENE